MHCVIKANARTPLGCKVSRKLESPEVSSVYLRSLLVGQALQYLLQTLGHTLYAAHLDPTVGALASTVCEARALFAGKKLQTLRKTAFQAKAVVILLNRWLL